MTSHRLEKVDPIYIAKNGLFFQNCPKKGLIMAGINFLKNFYNGIVNLGDSLQSLFLLATRLAWGLLFYFAGSKKLADISQTTGYFENLHIPFPEFTSHLVAWTETIGGICLILGFASRLVSIPLLITMLGAYLTAHFADLSALIKSPSTFLQAGPFTYLYALLVIFVFGPGKISMDYILEQLIGSGSGRK